MMGYLVCIVPHLFNALTRVHANLHPSPAVSLLKLANSSPQGKEPSVSNHMKITCRIYSSVHIFILVVIQSHHAPLGFVWQFRIWKSSYWQKCAVSACSPIEVKSLTGGSHL